MVLSIKSIYSQGARVGMRDFYKTLEYNSVFEADLDTNSYKFIVYNNTTVVIDINESGSGQIIVYFSKKNVYDIFKNFKTTYADGSGLYTFVLTNGNLFILNFTSNRYFSTFSMMKQNNTAIVLDNK